MVMWRAPLRPELAVRRTGDLRKGCGRGRRHATCNLAAAAAAAAAVEELEELERGWSAIKHLHAHEHRLLHQWLPGDCAASANLTAQRSRHRGDALAPNARRAIIGERQLSVACPIGASFHISCQRGNPTLHTTGSFIDRCSL